jgi:SAM-dependent methyltransferase
MSAMLSDGNKLLTGEDYSAAILSGRADRTARRAFQATVVRIATAGATILDFGAGTGIDAKTYAERGYRVLAYEPDPRMCEAFRRYCRQGLQGQQIELLECDYRDFLSSELEFAGRSIDLVTANFAPLNLVEDLNELFGRLRSITAPNARILASVLSPLFIGDIRYRWWWRNLPQMLRLGHFTFRGAAIVTRRSPANLAALAAPYFTLAGVGRHLPKGRLHRKVTPLWSPTLLASRYTILLFEKS